MRILFIIPPYRTTDALVAGLYPLPYAAVVLGTVLKRAGHGVVIKDFLLPAEHQAAAVPDAFIGKSAPAYMHYGQKMEICLEWLGANIAGFDVVCLCAGQCNLFETSEILAKRVKELGKPLVVGGSFVTTATNEARRRFNPDILVVGEAEGVIEEACRRAVSGLKEFGVIEGYPWDIKKSPVPDWSLVDLLAYPRVNGRVRGVLTVSRGCPHACKFCSVHTVHGRKYRRKVPDQIVAELSSLSSMGVAYFCFLDDNLFLTESAVDEMLSIISSLRESGVLRKKAQFYVEEGLEVRLAARPGIVKRLADAGFINIGLGLESMNSRGLEDMKKPHTREDINAAVEQLNLSGIRAKAFYIIGMPGDTLDSVCQNFVEFSGLGLAARANNLKLYPGTDVFKSFVGSGVIEEDYDWRLSSFWTPDLPGLSFREIKHLKAILNGISLAAELGLDILWSHIDVIKRCFEKAKYSLTLTEDTLTLSGHFFRASTYRNLLLLLALRLGFPGISFEVSETLIIAKRCAEPRGVIQLALGKAVRTALGLPVFDQKFSVTRKVEPTYGTVKSFLSRLRGENA